jgi:hypothetical protein
LPFDANPKRTELPALTSKAQEIAESERVAAMRLVFLFINFTSLI